MVRKEFKINRVFPKKIYIALVVLTFLTNVAIQPYQLALQGKAFEPDQLLNYAWLVLLNTLIYSLFASIGLYLAARIGLGLPFLEGLYQGKGSWQVFKGVLIRATILGVVAAVLVVVVSQVVFQDLVLSDMVSQGVDVTSLESRQPLWWQSLLASFYGGITEEIQLRLFLLSLLAWIGSRIWRDEEGRPVVAVLWSATVLSAIVFGLGHLPALSSMGLSITPVLLTSTVVQNGIGGIIFGWLYWRWGLESAVISHFTADIVIHVVLPMMVSMAG